MHEDKRQARLHGIDRESIEHTVCIIRRPLLLIIVSDLTIVPYIPCYSLYKGTIMFFKKSRLP